MKTVEIQKAIFRRLRRAVTVAKKEVLKMAKEIKKVVLAYSGGLDTSIIIPWLKENYNNCEVIAVSGDVGQGTELDGLEEKAIKTGASKLYIEDLKQDYIENYIWPCLKADAKYEDYLLGTSHARPCIAKPCGDRKGRGRGRDLPRLHRQGQRPGSL